MNILITGTSRGIGLALTVEALKNGHSVFAVARSTDSLSALQRDFQKQLTLVKADVSQDSGIKAVVEAVKSATLSNGALDTLINNAGVLKTTAETSDFAESFHLNAVVPFQLTNALMPYLLKSKEPRVVQITSKMGSIDDNSGGGYYAYRSSKSALNMITKSLAVDFPKVRFALVHPGWVKTDMGGSGAQVEVADSAKGIWNVINSMTLSKPAAFKDYQGKDIPW